MAAEEKPAATSRLRRLGRALLLALFGLTIYLAAESFWPPQRQPSARAGIALIGAYRSAVSPLLGAGGIRCRYTPSCSRYAQDALDHYGTLGGIGRAAGRLWRCSPWGGCGYDPAVTP